MYLIPHAPLDRIGSHWIPLCPQRPLVATCRMASQAVIWLCSAAMFSLSLMSAGGAKEPLRDHTTIQPHNKTTTQQHNDTTTQ